jgi:hypothetical protein
VLGKLFLGYLGFLAVGSLAIFLWVRLPPPEPTTAAAPPPIDADTFVSGYAEGRLALRARGAMVLIPPQMATQVRVKIDRVTGRGPVVWRSPFLFAFGVVPGVDGLVLHYGDREEWFMPDDLVSTEVLTGLAPFAFMEFEFGVDVPSLTRIAAARVGASREAWQRTPKYWERFRTESFVETAPQSGKFLPVFRTNVAGPKVTRANMRAAATAGGHYLLDKLRPDGSFVYEYHTGNDRGMSWDYSLPRHFGAAMYLAQIARYTQDPTFADGARRAFGYFEPHEGEVFQSAGSAALATLALTEYRQSGDTRYDGTLRRLGEFLLGMQKPAGDFAHDVRDREVKLLYFDGESAFALVRLAKAFGDEKYKTAAKRALDWLTKDAYGTFAGGFYFGEDHWTCMAAEAAWPLIDSPQYERFCNEYAKFLRRTQFAPGEGPADFTGAYGFTPFFPPHSTPAASRTEAMVSSYLLSKHRGHPVEATRVQNVRAFGYLLAQQIRSENSWLMARPDRSIGGWMQSPLRRFVRIDFVQHAGDALLRGEELVPE